MFPRTLCRYLSGLVLIAIGNSIRWVDSFLSWSADFLKASELAGFGRGSNVEIWVMLIVDVLGKTVCRWSTRVPGEQL